MTDLEGALRRICGDLSQGKADFALVGGLAVSARTEPRFTRDADLAVSVAADAEAEQLVHDLRGRGYRIEAVVEHEAVGRLATARLLASARPAPRAPSHRTACVALRPESRHLEIITSSHLENRSGSDLPSEW